MFRPLLAGLFTAGLMLAVWLPGTTAQPKKKERIAIAEPKDAAKDPDFAIQGEYEGTLTEENKKEEKIGIQVVAKGLGEFTVKAHRGGLPGAGWDGKTTLSFAANRQDGQVVIFAPNKD